MRINAGSFFGFNEFRISFRNQLPPIVASPKAPSPHGDSPYELRRILKHVVGLRESLAAFTEPVATSHRTTVSGTATIPASTQSSAALNLGTTDPTRATMQSTAEVNATPTSFTPRGPAFNGGTTSTPTIGGVYDGSNGTTTLTFRVVPSGVLGLERDLEVRDGQNQLVDTFDLPSLSQESNFALSNGLTLNLTEGSFEVDDTFQVVVFDTVGTVPNPDNPFNGVRNDHAELEEGFTITNGSFDVNGISIDVFSNDTIDSVLSRISLSAAGVDASYNSVSERIDLTQQSPGAAHSISLSNDTSGFLAAVKLDNAAVVPGEDGVDQKTLPLSQVGIFSGVQSGSLTINSVPVSFDVQADSIQDIVERINASSAGVNTSLDASPRFSIVASDSEASLVIGPDTTGLLSALNIADGSYEPTAGTSSVVKSKEGPSRSDAKKYVQTLEEIASSINRLFSKPHHGGFDGPFIGTLREVIEESTMELFDSDKRWIRTRSGVKFDFRSSTDAAFELGDSKRILKSIRSDPSQFNELLFGSDEKPGLLKTLSDLAARSESMLNDRLGPTGRFIDVLV